MPAAADHETGTERHAVDGTTRAVVAATGALLVVALYAAASAIAVLAYDASPFPVSYRIRYTTINGCTGLLATSIALRAVLALLRDFRLERLGISQADARRPLRRARSIGALLAGTAIAMVVAWFETRLPLVERRGLLGLPASARFSLDQLSRRPTIDVQTNEVGFRDRSWRERPWLPGGPFRVLLLGDSVTFGSGISNQQETLTPVLENTLAPSRLGEPPRVFNISENGLNFAQEVDLLSAFVDDVRPNLVVVLHNDQNDLMPLLPYYAHPRLFAAFPLSFISYVTALDGYKGSHRLSDSPGAVDRLERDTERLADIAAAHGFEVLFVYVGGHCPPDYFRPPARAKRLFAYTVLGDWSERAALTFPNDFHPNPSGVRWMAEKLAPKLVRIAAEGATWPGNGADPLTREFRELCLHEPPAPAGPVSMAPQAPSSAPSEAGSGRTEGALPVLPPEAMERLVHALEPHRVGSKIAGWTLGGIHIDRSEATISLAKGSHTVRIVLKHPTAMPAARAKSRSFAIEVDASGAEEDASGTAAANQLVLALTRGDEGGFWITAGADAGSVR